MSGQLIKRGENTWLVRVSLGRDVSGKRLYHNHTVKGSKKDAERYRTKKLREVDTGTFVEPSQQALADFLRGWLSTTVAPRVRAKTLADYRSLSERYIAPALGNRALSRVTSHDIQGLYASLSARGLSPRTVRYVHAVLSGALQHAVRWQVLAANPAKLVGLPRHSRKEMRSLTGEESIRFLESAKGTRFEALWFLLLTAGLRPCEALGLKWSDLRDDEVVVQRSLAWVSGFGPQFNEPKTLRGRRVINLPASTQRVLRAHRAKQVSDRLSVGSSWEDNDLIFANHTGGPLEWRVVARRYFRPVLRQAGLNNFRPYDLRHSCASLLLASGENFKVVSERLGHATAAMTLDVYAHVLPGMQKKAAERLEGLLFAEVGG